MTILVLAIALGVVVGVAAGGDLTNLSTYRVRAWPLILAAVLLEMTAGGLPAGWRWVAAVAAATAAAAWCGANTETAAAPAGPELIGVGAALNTAVMAANRGMPVSLPALSHAGLPATLDVTRGHLYKHVPMTGHTALAFLGDAIPVAPFTAVISLGDVIMLVGVAVVVARAVRGADHGALPLVAVGA